VIQDRRKQGAKAGGGHRENWAARFRSAAEKRLTWEKQKKGRLMVGNLSSGRGSYWGGEKKKAKGGKRTWLHTFESRKKGGGGGGIAHSIVGGK